MGSDRYRHLRGPACQCRPIRQDYLDELVWQQVVQLLNDPELVRAEIQRRIQESQSSDPVQQHKMRLEREFKRIASQLDKLLDAYQEDLIGLADLRSRAPELRRRQAAIEKGTARGCFASPGEKPLGAIERFNGELPSCFAAIGKEPGGC